MSLILSNDLHRVPKKFSTWLTYTSLLGRIMLWALAMDSYYLAVLKNGTSSACLLLEMVGKCRSFFVPDLGPNH